MSYCLGIYFSENYSHAVLIRRHKKQYHWADDLKLTIEASTNQSPAKHLSILKNHFKKTKTVALGLHAHDVFMQQISIDHTLSDKDIRQYIKQLTKTPYIDYENIKTTKQQQILRVVSAQPTVILKKLAMFQKAKHSIHSIDIDVLALQTAINLQSTVFHKPKYYDLHFSVALGLALRGFSG